MMSDLRKRSKFSKSDLLMVVKGDDPDVYEGFEPVPGLGGTGDTGQEAGDFSRRADPDPDGNYYDFDFDSDFLFNFNTHISGSNSDPTNNNYRF